jgi:hypothetical protein
MNHVIYVIYLRRVGGNDRSVIDVRFGIRAGAAEERMGSSMHRCR